MRSKSVVCFVAVMLASLLTVAAVMPGCSIPKFLVDKPEKVVIYHFGDLRGPYADVTAPIVAGFEDFANWYNEEEGGIDGVPIAQHYIDTGGDLQAALRAYETIKVARPYPYVCLLYGSTEAERLQRDFVEDGICCFTSAPPGIYPVGYEFSTIPTYADSLGAFMDWVTGTWSQKTGQPVRLSILTWDNTYGNAVRTEAVKKYAAQKGIELVYDDFFKVEDSDVAAQMKDIRDAGANWIYDNTLSTGVHAINSSAFALGILSNDIFDTGEGKIHRATGPWGMDDSSVMLSGTLAEGMVGPRSIASWSMSEEMGVVKALAAFNKNKRDPEQRNIGYLATWPVLYTVCDCIKNTVSEKGWKNLNGAEVKEQFLKLKDYSPMGMTVYTFTPDRPSPDKTLIFKVERGRLLPITDWVTCPDLRPESFKP